MSMISLPFLERVPKECILQRALASRHHSFLLHIITAHSDVTYYIFKIKNVVHSEGIVKNFLLFTLYSPMSMKKHDIKQ